MLGGSKALGTGAAADSRAAARHSAAQPGEVPRPARSVPEEFIGAILGTLEKAGRWEACVWLLHRAEMVDVIAFNTAIVACGKGGRWRDALKLLGQMRAQELRPTVVSYSSAIWP